MFSHDSFDYVRGTNTAGISRLWWLRFLRGKKADCSRYQAVDEAVFREAVKGLPRLPFVDLGCGKGKGLILARECGFPSVIGVDFSASLCRVARKNCSIRFIAADIRCQDAREFVFPEEPCVVFLYNPFGADIMEAVARNIPAGSIVIYVNPRHAEVFESFDTIRTGESFSILESHRSNPYRLKEIDLCR